MQRRDFLQIPAAAAVARGATVTEIPPYRASTPYPKGPDPNRYRGRVIGAHMEGNPQSVATALAASMKKLTGASDVREAWRTFISPDDVVGIKVNCSGSPKMMSHPLVVAEIAHNVIACGVSPKNVYLYERFGGQLHDANYPAVVPAGVQIHAMESGDRRQFTLKEYDPRVFLDVAFFSEDQTRSFMSRLVTEKLTKIINVPNMKDHGASGVTGCLKNIAYGSFSNVARSHEGRKTNTLTFIGSLYNVEPLRSRTVLHVMDGIKGVWQGGPFLREDRFGFEPKRLMLGTDPVAMDRLLLDIIEEKRKAEGWPSVWDHSPEAMKRQTYEREPGHIEFAGSLGFGESDKSKIRLEEVSL